MQTSCVEFSKFLLIVGKILLFTSKKYRLCHSHCISEICLYNNQKEEGESS